MAGNAKAKGMVTYAGRYGGHQFGHWAGQLGDGRAIELGEVLTPSGQRWALQLKGAGPTPYSRMADGRAVMRSSVREFLCSEAMHHLGVPTTRALSLVHTGDSVVRDVLRRKLRARTRRHRMSRITQFYSLGHFGNTRNEKLNYSERSLTSPCGHTSPNSANRQSRPIWPSSTQSLTAPFRW